MRKLCKRFVSWILLFVTVISTINCSTLMVKADSTRLRETYLALMSGAGAADVDDIEELNVNDLRVIALYLSNFYVPFNTSLDDTENKDANMQLMINCLKGQEGLGMKQDVAEVLVESVYQASLGSAQQLYISKQEICGFWDGVIQEPMFFHTGHPEVYTDGWKQIGASILKFFREAITPPFKQEGGQADENLAFVGVDAVECDSNSNYNSSKGLGSSSGDYYPISIFEFITLMARDFDVKDSGIKLYYNGSTGMQPCFEINSVTKDLFTYLVSEVDPSDHKAGNAVLNCSYNEYKELGNDEKLALTSFTQKMYVDWVGNIIVDFGDTRVIAIPACVNPYVFGRVSDTDVKARINLVSSWGAKILGSSVYDFDSGTFTSTSKSLNMGLGEVRGSAISSQLFDSYDGIGPGDGGEVSKYLTDLGVYTGWFGDFGDPIKSINWQAGGHEVTKDNGIGEYLQYMSISNPNLDSDSAFAKLDFWGNGVETYFKETSTFSKKSDDFTSYIQFSKTDLIMMRNIFLTYVFAYNNRNAASFDESKNYIDVKFNAKNFPESTNTSIVWDSVNSDSEKITSFIYYLLHPTEGVRYVATWFKNKVSGILVSWHEDVVGGTDSNSTTGMTQYLGFTGYVTSPSLEEISWVASLIERYDSLIVFLVILMTVILLCYVLTGYMTLQRGVIGVVFFTLLAFIPPIAISSVTTIINNICDTLYSEKFDYWSYTQLQTYLVKLSSVKSAGTVNDYINALMEIETSSIDTANGFSGVKLKWMSPKKVRDTRVGDELGSVIDTDSPDSLSSTLVNMVTVNTTNSARVESYVEGMSAAYLYRDFVDIFRYGASSYNLFTTYNFNGALDEDEDLARYAVADDIEGSGKGIITWARDSQLKKVPYDFSNIVDGAVIDTNYDVPFLKDYILSNVETIDGQHNAEYILDTSSLNAIRRGFLNDVIGLKSYEKGDDGNRERKDANYYFKDGALSPSLLLSYSSVPHKLVNNLTFLNNDLKSATFELRVSDMSNNNMYYGLPPRTFDYSLDDLESNGVADDGDIPTPDQLSAFYYALYAESPYYYFNYNFRDYMARDKGGYKYKSNSLDSSTRNVYKVFTRDNQEYFYNLENAAGDGYGELKDFMNFHDLFYYVMPVLNIGNRITDTFDSQFGMYVYDDLSLKITPEGKIKYNGVVYDDLKDMADKKDESGKNTFEQMSDEELYKFWHDYNVWTIFQGYVPWLDTMQDCKYAKPENIEVLGEKFLVTNPLDPTTYFKAVGDEIVEGRYMVFSRSEMAYYGLDLTDLTTVERKIVEIQDNVYRQALDLMNYYTLADEVLINAFAMIQTFEFNKEFSQPSLFGSSYVMYPQGYEAKAFTYDAYLRLVISEASKEPIQVDHTSDTISIYRRVISKTSLFFGLFLLINDVLSVYIIPCLKVAFLIMLFFTSVLLIIAASVKLELNIVSVCWKSIFQPLLSYFLVSVGFAWLVSLFMSNGASGVTAVSTTISVGDPTTVIIIMIVINVAVMILYFKIARSCFKDLKLYLQSVVDSIASTVVGALQRMGAVVANGKRNKAYRALNKMASGVPSTPSQRGSQNTGVGAGIAGLAGAGVGAALMARSQSGMGSDDEVDAKKGMSKRDAKAYDKAASKGAQLREREAELQRKRDVAEANGKDTSKIDAKLAKNNTALRNIDARRDGIQKYGAVGYTKKAIGAKAHAVGAGIASAKDKAGRFGKGVLNGNAAMEVGDRVGRMVTGAENAKNSAVRGVKQGAMAVRRGASTVKKGVSDVTSGRALQNAKQSMGNAGKRVYNIAGNAAKNVKNTASRVKNAGSSAVRQSKEGFKVGYDVGRGR